MPYSLVILAAGNGSRFGGPKQFFRFGPLNLTLMEYNILNAYKYGCREVIFVIQNKHQEQLKNQILKNIPFDIKVSVVVQSNENLPESCYISNERNKPLGTAHAIWCCKDYINGSFAVINGDDYYGFNSFKLLESEIKNNNKDHLLISFKLKNTLSSHGGVNRAVCSIDNNSLLFDIREVTNIINFNKKYIGYSKYRETLNLKEDSLVSMNFWLFNRSIFYNISKVLISTFSNVKEDTVESHLADVISREILDNKVKIKTLISEDQWCGVTYYNDVESVNNYFHEIVVK
jgi:NDP-sugar pyrophosphorylase family protein